MYRTIVQNSLDPCVLDLDEYRNYAREDSEDREKIIQAHLIRSRMGRLWQRWAEALRDGHRAPILDHIKNLSQKLEDENIETYELILSEKLYQQERIWIHTDVVHNELNILAIFPLLNLPMIQSKVSDMHKLVRDIAENEDAWKEIYSIMADHVFVDSWDSKGKELNQIEATYQNLAKIGFYPTKSSELEPAERVKMEAQLQTALSEILRVNLHLFPDSSEIDWFMSPLTSSLLASDWVEFFSVLGGSSQGRRTKNQLNRILPGFLNLSEVADLNVLVERIYNPLIIQIVRLFIDERGQQGLLCEDWLMAVNYFIWLSFFRDHLNIQTYFVHHAHNLRRHLAAFLGDQGDNKGYPTPSGIIVCAHERLSLGARRDYRQVFTQVMNPLEALIQAEFLTTDLATSESQLKNHAQKAAISQVMARNTSHNIGSHVMNKLVGDLSEIKFDKIYRPKLKIIDLHKNKNNSDIILAQLSIFNNYVKCRMDYLSDITYGIPLMQTSKSAEEIFDDLDKVRLLLENISGLTGFEYKIEFKYPFGVDDLILAMPNDVLGCQALYNIIENVIRNTAKHGKHSDKNNIKDEKGLVIFTVEFNEVSTESLNDLKKELDELYEVKIYDNLAISGSKVAWSDSEKDEYRSQVYGENEMPVNIDNIDYRIWRQNTKINDSILNETNALRPSNLGLIEMEASACYLRKVDMSLMESDEYHVELSIDYANKFNNKFNKLNILKALKIDNNSLGYRFYVLKPTEVLIVSDNIKIALTHEHIRGGLKKLSVGEFNSQLSAGKVFNHELLIYDSSLASEIILNNKTSLTLRCCYIENIVDLITNKTKDDILFKAWDNWNIKLKEICNNFEITGVIPSEMDKTFYVLYDHLYDETQRKKATVIIGNYIKNKKNNIYLECLSSLAQAKLPFFKELSKENSGNAIGKYYNNVRLPKSNRSIIAQIQILESTLTKILVIDERIQNALFETYMGLSYSDLYKMINILVPKKPTEIQSIDENAKEQIDLSGNSIEKNDFIDVLKNYNGHMKNRDFIVIHYSILERVYNNDKGDINECLRSQARICNVVVTSGRGTPGKLPVEVRFINLSSFLYAFLEVRSKHYINYVLNSTRKSNRI